MAEKLQVVDLQILSPEYWEKHSPADDCEWTTRSSHIFEDLYNDPLRTFAQSTIVDFLCKNQGKSTPISTLKSGNTFDGNRLPEGTIIKYEREQIKIRHGAFNWGKPYTDFELWGVVCNYTDDYEEIKKTILPFAYFPSYGDLLPIPREDPKITEGQVSHTKIKSKVDNRHISESLVKISHIEVHRIP